MGTHYRTFVFRRAIQIDSIYWSDKCFEWCNSVVAISTRARDNYKCFVRIADRYCHFFIWLKRQHYKKISARYSSDNNYLRFICYHASSFFDRSCIHWFQDCNEGEPSGFKCVGLRRYSGRTRVCIGFNHFQQACSSNIITFCSFRFVSHTYRGTLLGHAWWRNHSIHWPGRNDDDCGRRLFGKQVNYPLLYYNHRNFNAHSKRKRTYLNRFTRWIFSAEIRTIHFIHRRKILHVS